MNLCSVICNAKYLNAMHINPFDYYRNSDIKQLATGQREKFTALGGVSTVQVISTSRERKDQNLRKRRGSWEQSGPFTYTSTYINQAMK